MLSRLSDVFSLKREIKLTLLAFLIILSLPVIAVFILTHTGVNVVSDALIGINANTQAIEIKDPKTGEVIKEIYPEITWPAQGTITLRFGESSFVQLFHTGLDIANYKGYPITPFMNGAVIYEGETFFGYGKHIIIDHGDNITSVYAHLDKIYVYQGQEVKVGDQIGNMGETGWATGPHLHFEVRIYGIPVNPEVFLHE